MYYIQKFINPLSTLKNKSTRKYIKEYNETGFFPRSNVNIPDSKVLQNLAPKLSEIGGYSFKISCVYNNAL
jgi:hypothetical protein